MNGLYFVVVVVLVIVLKWLFGVAHYEVSTLLYGTKLTLRFWFWFFGYWGIGSMIGGKCWVESLDWI